MTDALDLSARLAAAVSDHLRVAGHGGCGGGFLDPSEGVVCNCGTITGPLADQPAAPVPAASAGDVTGRNPVDDAPAVIDADAPYTPEDLERAILRTTGRIESGMRFEVQTIERAEDAALAFELAYAQAVVDANDLPGGADVRKARALLACEELYREKHHWEALAKTVKAAMHNLRSTLSGYQSTAASARATMNVGGSNGPTPARRPM